MRPTCFLVFCLLAAGAVAQQPAAEPPPAEGAQQVVAREFGRGFIVDAKTPVMFGDIDGDGQEDAVIVATAKNPLVDDLEFHYRVVDPYDAYFGFGDPKITMQFSATNVGPPRYVLVIHNWHAPKAKFVIINLPFDRLSLSKVRRKKKSVGCIHAEEASGLTSDVYWDGKKYKWEPAYFNQ